jgi:purine-binding chemotaxis protein CheW
MNTILENSAVDAAYSMHASKYLTFTLGKESYGVEVLKIREIIRLQDITQVPQMPPHIKGVINLRGKIIPVMDLRIKFNLAEALTTESTCIIVVNLEIQRQSALMGLIVDGVEEVMQISASDIEESPHFGSAISLNHILGMAKIKGSVKTLLDINQVIDSDTLAQCEQIEHSVHA